jgi:hypothetical protein
MRFIPISFLAFSFMFFYSARDKEEQLAIARIQYIYMSKQIIGDPAWSSFGSEQNNIPLIYYTSNATFISNPTEKFIRQFDPKLIFKSKSIQIFKLDYRIDSTPLHMQASAAFGADTSAYDYHSLYIKCSSREEFETVTGYPTSTALWASMVLHECFHGFQFLHPGYVEQAIQSGFISPSVGDSLQYFYKSYEWFRKSIDTENDLLLKAIQSDREYETDSLVREFLKLRDQRRLRTKSETNYDIGLLEKSFETMEGTARFIEAYALEHPVKDDGLRAIDSSFKTTGNSMSYKLPEYLYKTALTVRYFYATGYNQTRLLRKLNKDCCALLFKQPSLTLEDIVKTVTK